MEIELSQQEVEDIILKKMENDVLVQSKGLKIAHAKCHWKNHLDPNGFIIILEKQVKP